jgi:hypothetical protein
MITITHSEISATTAGRMGKGYTAEGVAKTVSEYANSMVQLMKEKRPTSTKESTLVENPICGFKIDKHDSGVVKNPDGTETKIGEHYTVQTAVPKAVINGINADLIGGIGKIIGAVAGALKQA